MADGSRTAEIEADAAAAEAAREAKAEVLERAAKVESAETLPLTGKSGKTKADKASKKSQWAEFVVDVSHGMSAGLALGYVIRPHVPFVVLAAPRFDAPRAAGESPRICDSANGAPTLPARGPSAAPAVPPS